MKLFYFTLGGEEMASSRVRVWRVVPELRKLGHEVTINGHIDGAINSDIVVFQKKYLPREIQRVLSARGSRKRPIIVYDLTDNLFVNHKKEVNYMISRADMVVLSSPRLAHYIPVRKPTAYIDDALDLSDNNPRKESYALGERVIVWFGNPDNIYHLELLHNVSLDGFSLEIITMGTPKPPVKMKIRFKSWDPKFIDQQIICADCVICPLMEDVFALGKTPNRILKAMGLGAPVLCSNNESFKMIPEIYRVNNDKWQESLEMAMKDLTLREHLGKNGIEFAGSWRACRIAKSWEKLFNALKTSPLQVQYSCGIS